MSKVKMWCLHCEKTFYEQGKECPYCGAGGMDICKCSARTGFFKQAYPNLKTKDVEVGKYYPLYPEENN